MFSYWFGAYLTGIPRTGNQRLRALSFNQLTPHARSARLRTVDVVDWITTSSRCSPPAYCHNHCNVIALPKQISLAVEDATQPLVTISSELLPETQQVITSNLHGPSGNSEAFSEALEVRSGHSNQARNVASQTHTHTHTAHLHAHCTHCTVQRLCHCFKIW